MKIFILSVIGLLTVVFLTTQVQASTVCACLAPSSIPTQIPTVIPSVVTPTVFVQVTESPTASPEATIEVTQAVTPTVQVQSPHGDFLSDGRESGHVNAPSIPRGAPNTGRGI